jgi:hypothetical protein
VPPKKPAQAKKEAPVKKKEVKAPKTQQKTTAMSSLPPTSAPEKWRLQERKNVVVTGETIDSLNDLDLALMEVSASTVKKADKPSETPAPAKEKAPAVKEKQAALVQKPVEIVKKADKTPLSDKDADAQPANKEDETPVTVSVMSIKPTVVKTVKTTPKEVVVEEKVVMSSAATAVEAEIATGKKLRVEQTPTPALKEAPAPAVEKQTEVKKPSAPQTAAGNPVETKAASEKPAEQTSVLKKEPVAPQQMTSSDLEKQTTSEKALKTTHVGRAQTDKPVKILRDSVTTRVNPYGEEEVFIVIERTDEPGRVLTPQQLDELINKAQ